MCNTCRSRYYPHLENDEQVDLERHPIQCKCTPRQFKLALMLERKRHTEYDWHGQDPVDCAPLGALLFTRCLISFKDDSATATDLEDNFISLFPDFDKLQAQEGSTADEDPATVGDSDMEQNTNITLPSGLGSFYETRVRETQQSSVLRRLMIRIFLQESVAGNGLWVTSRHW